MVQKANYQNLTCLAKQATENDIVNAYRLILGREPENRTVIESRIDKMTIAELRQEFLNSDEFLKNTLKNINIPLMQQSPFFHYAASFDPLEIMHKYAVANLRSNAKYLTNFLGVLIDPKFFPTILADKAGHIEPIPIPANWHTDIAELGAALRAVNLSHETFTMIELGCGWGCWMNNTGVAAKKIGKKVHLVGVEADLDHIKFAQESLATNGFLNSEITLHHGIAASKYGIALFPRQTIPGSSWGNEPIFNVTEEKYYDAVSSGRYLELPMIALENLTKPFDRIDLLHIDIQGGEFDLIQDCVYLLNKKVAYMVIGTHSKQIEGNLFETLLNAGWDLEMERPAIFQIVNGKPITTVDGLQGWRNRKLFKID
ncbi:FkbM family methyltransferase [Desulfococcaceae bacterium OttesenSCG-928-F15]|nr:FkbM family methyltransferase [Desulfococcaceae bacterium OttesenSCG-928-F15]